MKILKNIGLILLGVLILPLSLLISNLVSNKSVSPIKTFKIDLNDTEFTKLTYYQSNYIYYVAEVENYFVVLKSYENISTGVDNLIVNEDNKFVYVSEEDLTEGDYYKLYIFDSIREDTNIMALIGDTQSAFEEIYNSSVSCDKTDLVNKILTGTFGTADKTYNFETEYNFFSYSETTSEDTTTISKMYDFDCCTLSLINNDLAGQEIGELTIYLK